MPDTFTAAAFAAAASATTLALLGVDYYALLWAFIGALAALWQAGTMRRYVAVLFVALSTLLGAAMGSAAVLVIGTNHLPVLILACLVCGAGAQVLLGAAIKRVAELIANLGGNKT